MALDSEGNAHIGWLAKQPIGPNTTDIFYRKISDSGTNLTSNIQLTIEGNSSGVFNDNTPSLKVDQYDNVHIAWTDNRTNGKHQVFYMMLDNNGNTVIDDYQLVYSENVSERPSLAIDDLGPVVVWQDTRDSTPTIVNSEIYYKRNSQLLNIDNLTVVFVNNTERIFRYSIVNIGNETLSGINWTFNTGDTVLNSTFSNDLVSGEDLLVFIYHNYSLSGNFSAIATGFNRNTSASAKINVVV